MSNVVNAVLDGTETSRVQPVFLRYPELRQCGVPYSRQHLDTLEREGSFPRRVKLSPGVVVWRLADVRAWLESRAKQSA